MAAHVGIIPNGDEVDRLLAYVQRLEELNSEPVGILWDKDSSSPTLTRIDLYGNTLPTSTAYFNRHVLWGGMRTCTIDRTTKAIEYGSTNRGDGLVKDGSTGKDLFVSYPASRVNYGLYEGDPCWWDIPYTTGESTYSMDPAFVQRGGTIRNVIYIGAYESGLRDDAGTLKLKSVSGAQPWTGGGMYSRTFTSGSTAFTPDETLTGATSAATAKIVDYHLTGGSWAGGDAAGVVYLKLPSGTFTTEDVNGSTSGANCATFGGALTAISLTLDQAEGYANALGSGFGICNVWTYASLQRRMYIEFGTLNLQTSLGRGIVDLSGAGYAGKNTGADSIDSLLASNGTGVGSGTNGQTPIKWRGLENLYGNTWEVIAGLNLFLSDGSYHILRRDGTGAPSATLADGSYETGVGTVPIAADGYINGIQSEELGALAFIPSTNTGSSSTYFCDQLYYPRYSPSIVRFGGHWNAGNIAGAAARDAAFSPSASYINFGARIEYIPQT